MMGAICSLRTDLPTDGYRIYQIVREEEGSGQFSAIADRSVSHTAEVRSSCSLPVFVGSGVTTSNVHQFADADALIVGSDFKKDGKWQNELEPQRVQQFMDRVRNHKWH
ncbi:hypothetical protein OESDEN_14370 [Oesophagostomum dentatum]|uniref:Phosphoribosylanthranilate isomerase n=1 Tax=Oesophagostomum dentatum TaxID=61180 RepID=A0A0B1SQT6_OESDE|nr:hypothetical protein OESDEN_14370 [Oesophagostomum dentatum]